MRERGVRLVEAREAGLDEDGVHRAFGLLEGWIGEGVLPGAAALIARGGRIVAEAYLGSAQRREGRNVDADAELGDARAIAVVEAAL